MYGEGKPTQHLRKKENDDELSNRLKKPSYSLFHYEKERGREIEIERGRDGERRGEREREGERKGKGERVCVCVNAII